MSLINYVLIIKDNIWYHLKIIQKVFSMIVKYIRINHRTNYKLLNNGLIKTINLERTKIMKSLKSY